MPVPTFAGCGLIRRAVNRAEIDDEQTNDHGGEQSGRSLSFQEKRDDADGSNEQKKKLDVVLPEDVQSGAA